MNTVRSAFLSICLTLALASAAVAAPITYSVSRTIGAGTVAGTIETDGTIGTLAGGNILNWSITLTSPTLNGGSTDTFSGVGAILVGSGLVGSLTDLVFDFSAFASGFALAGGSFGNGWCMASAGIACDGESTPAESIFYSNGGGPAETEARSGRVSIATASAVPVPATLALVGAALLGAAGATRRRKVV